MHHLLLAPIDRGTTLRRPTIGILGYGVLAGVVVGGLAAGLMDQRLSGAALPWFASGAVFGAAVAALSLGAGLVTSSRLVPRWRAAPGGVAPAGMVHRGRGRVRPDRAPDRPGAGGGLAARLRPGVPGAGRGGGRPVRHRGARHRRAVGGAGPPPDRPGGPAPLRRHPTGPAHRGAAPAAAGVRAPPGPPLVPRPARARRPQVPGPGPGPAQRGPVARGPRRSGPRPGCRGGPGAARHVGRHHPPDPGGRTGHLRRRTGRRPSHWPRTSTTPDCSPPVPSPRASSSCGTWPSR